jgi:hypothetical protein
MGVLNLPNINPHGYGVPQILSQWQAGLDSRENQKRYETELDFKKKESARAEKQFDMQTQTHKAEMENKQEGSLTDVQKQAAMDKRAGYVPQTKKEAIELRKSGATQINLGEVADKIKTQEQAKDEAKWIGTSAREEAEKIAKNTIGDDWVDLTKDEKSAQTQTVLHRKLISIYGDKVKYGQDNGVLGWYLQDETGAMKLIKRWQ